METFYGCANIPCVVSESVYRIEEKAFSDCRVNTIICKATTPPECKSEAFEYCTPQTIKVPKESINQYKEADVWKDFWFALEAIEE